MARRRSTALATRPSVVVMQAPRGRLRRAARRVGSVARRGGQRVARVGARSLPTLSVVLGGAAVGYADAKGFLDVIPTIMGSRMMTIGIAGWAATRYVRSPAIKAAGMAALGAAAYDFGRKQGGGASGFDDDY